MVVDYRHVNSVTWSDTFLLPHIMQTLDMVSKSKFFMSFDLVKGYYQIGMMDSVKHIASFTCEFGNFTFNRMPFGLLTASFTFQKLMNILLMP